MKKIVTKIHTNILVFILVLILFSFCKQKDAEIQNTQKWEEFNIDNKISEKEIFKKLDKEKEIFSALERDTLMRKTTDLAYINNRNPSYDMTKYSKMNNCRAYFWKKDTLSIKIGIGNGFGGSGFIILIKNNKFYTEPYLSTDVIIEGEKESVYKIIWQEFLHNSAETCKIMQNYLYKVFDPVYFDS